MKKKLKKIIKRMLYGNSKQVNTQKPKEEKLPYEAIGEAWSDNEKPIAFMFGFNPWKREHTSKFFPEYRTAYVFGSANLNRFSTIFNENKDFVFIIWGFKEPTEFLEYADRNNVTVYRVEDGFVRSVGLGAAHTLPLSIIADSRTLYFDSREASDLEVIVETTDFSDKQELLKEAERCMNMLINMGVSKYNHATRTDVKEIYGEKTKKRILVIGQVEDDASIRYGCSTQMTNNDLVRAAYEENPDAEIIYKPHPDVLGGFRKAYSNPMDVADISKVVTAPLSLVDAFETIDHVYTITSLSGFEALLRGIEVTCFGAPFYSGWGLTNDRQPVERRTQKRSLTELFAAAYMLYPKYLNPETDQLIDLEEAIFILKEMMAKNTFNQAMVKRKEKNLEMAEELIKQAISQTFNQDLTVKWYIELVHLLKQQERNEEALQIVSDLLDKTDSEDRKALLLNQRASILRILGDYYRALSDSEQAYQYKKNPNILNTLIELKWEIEGLSAELVNYVDEVISLFGKISAPNIKTYASIYCEAGDTQKALSILKNNNIKMNAGNLPYLGLNVLKEQNMTEQTTVNKDSQIYKKLVENEGTFKSLVGNMEASICVIGTDIPAELNGDYIDNQDIVIRIGQYKTDYPHSKSIGTKTDILFKSSEHQYDNLNESNLIVINENNPVYRFYNGYRIFSRDIERGKKVEVYPSNYYRELLRILGSKPSDEIMAIYWLYKIRGPLSEKNIIGFSYYNNAQQDNENWKLEKQLFEALFKDDQSFEKILETSKDMAIK